MINLQYFKRDPDEDEEIEVTKEEEGLPHPPNVPIKPSRQNFK